MMTKSILQQCVEKVMSPIDLFNYVSGNSISDLDAESFAAQARPTRKEMKRELEAEEEDGSNIVLQASISNHIADGDIGEVDEADCAADDDDWNTIEGSTLDGESSDSDPDGDAIDPDEVADLLRAIKSRRE